MEIKAIFFDIGGVVINDHALRAQALAALKIRDAEAFWHAFNEAALPACRGEEPFKNAWERVGKSLGVDVPDNVAERLWIDGYGEQILIDGEVVKIINELKPRAKLGVISNTFEEHARILRNLKVYDPFDAVILSHEVGSTKDKNHIFEVALGKFNIAPNQAVFIDDVERFRSVAVQIGMHGILFKNAPQLRSELKEIGIL